MSESASEPKVEDVLSSVRRLVSGELPRKPRPSLPEGPGALVLTDAQRVSESPRVTSRSLEDRIAELEAAVGQQPDEFEPDGSEDQSQHRPDRMVYTRPPSSAEQDEARRSTLRLSQLALVETGPANEDENSDETVTFTHARATEIEAEDEAEADDVDEFEEAPMAEDVPVQRAIPAEVAAFTNPDDVVERLEARLKGGAEEPVQATHVPQPPAPIDADAGDDMDDEAFEEALNRAIEGDLQDARETELADEGSAEGPGEEAHSIATFESTEEAVAETLDEFAEDDSAREAIDEDDAFETGDELGVAEVFEVAEALEDDAAEVEKVAEIDEADEFDEAVDEELPETAAPPEAADVVHFDDTGHGAVSEAPVDEFGLDEAEAQTDDLSEPAEYKPEIPAEAVAAVADAALSMLDDEAAARLLVARLIREELQGELGERITRNVRKLVRREIKRALTSQDLS